MKINVEKSGVTSLEGFQHISSLKKVFRLHYGALSDLHLWKFIRNRSMITKLIELRRRKRTSSVPKKKQHSLENIQVQGWEEILRESFPYLAIEAQAT